MKEKTVEKVEKKAVCVHIHVHVHVKPGSKNQSLVTKLCFEKTAVEMHYGGI